MADKTMFGLDNRRESVKMKDSIERWSTNVRTRKSGDSYNSDEYLTAMKRVFVRSSIVPKEMLSPRERHRKRDSKKKTLVEGIFDVHEATKIGTIASMVPDEIIHNHTDKTIRSYETALMFIDVSGFTDLCETYTKAGCGGPSKLTQVLNSYIGAMVQEILTHNGDVLKFSGDAFLSMWKKTSTLTMQDVVHTAIDCGLIIQKNYGTHITDRGVILKVKVAISAGMSHFSIISDSDMLHSQYVLIGQPVWDVKMAEYVSTAGDVLTSASAWIYVNEAEYCTQPCGDGRHTKVLGVGVTWKRVEKVDYALGFESQKDFEQRGRRRTASLAPGAIEKPLDYDRSYAVETPEIREYSLRPSVVSALRSTWWPALRRFMVTPVLRAVDNDEPMDFLTEVRHVVVVFINIITKCITEDVLIDVVDTSYKCVCSVTSESGGLVNKINMFDKDMMFLVVFGLRGLKHEDEAQKALLCAYQLKQKLVDPNIMSVSIGITSGRTYCGVVGHVLRREYTVIGSAVNKAARLMMAYTNKVTCDKETFVRSKLDLDMFRLMETKPLKGIAKPGPIYEFNKTGWPNRMMVCRHPILGRNEELRKYKTIIQNAIDSSQQRFTRYRDHQFAVAIIGPKMVGKSRLMDEFLNITPSFMRMEKLTMTEKDKVPYGFIRTLFELAIGGSSSNISRDLIKPVQHQPLDRVPQARSPRLAEDLPFHDGGAFHLHSSILVTPRHLDFSENFRSIITSSSLNHTHNNLHSSLATMSQTPLEIFAVNTIFECGFPLPENFTYDGDLLSEPVVRNLLQEICMKRFPALKVVGVKRAEFIDELSWRILLLLLHTKHIFVILTLADNEELSTVAHNSLASNMIVKMTLTGIDRWYHAALACQLLDVQAIPADLEKVMESASGGLPGWIQNLVISLIQRGELNVVTVSRTEAVESGAVLPSTALLQRSDTDGDESARNRVSFQSGVGNTYSATISIKDGVFTMSDTDKIQMAVLAESYNFDDMKVDMTMDVVILKTYDSLNPFEKMMLKCSSVLGDVFSRRMMLHLLQSDSQRKVAQAVAKLFEIRVLECEGADFTCDSSMVLLHPAPAALPSAKPPYCTCLGTTQPPNCRDLPAYASCGYMKFRHSLFRTTTYELLTESQKREMHARALLYLERYTRRCVSCGAGCFTRLFGVKCDDGLVPERKEVRRVREQIAAISAETRMTTETVLEPLSEPVFNIPVTPIDEQRGLDILEADERRRPSHTVKINLKPKRVRSFSSLQLDTCECLPILLSVYSQVIEHCREVGQCEKLFETYIEYADLSLLNLNIPQTVRLLLEAEEFVNQDTRCGTELCEIKWMKDFRLARIFTSRGHCMLESGDVDEARKHLFRAMRLYGDAFPTSKCWAKIRNQQETFNQFMALYVVPRFYIATESGFVGQFYDHVSWTLNQLYRLFYECKENKNAVLAAKWSLNYALKSNATFRTLCVAYSNMIAICRENQEYSKCLKLEKMATEICQRKRGRLDVTEVFGVCSLYTRIFMFYVEYGKKMESLEFGLSVIPLMSGFSDLTTCQTLVLWMLKLLLSDLRIREMVMLMREFFYMTDSYDLSSETWYYYYAIVILLDTGYCVESYGNCERFYIKKGDAIVRSKCPEAAWNFFVCMWLTTIRVGAWERSILWEEKINNIVKLEKQKGEYQLMILIRLIEGFLITLVKEVNNRNIRKVLELQTCVKRIFNNIEIACKHAPRYRARYFLMLAYYNIVSGKKKEAFSNLSKATQMANRYGLGTLKILIEHNLKHWTGTLNPKFVDYWSEHIEADNLLDYTDFDMEKGQIIPYTLPLPADFDK